MSRSKDPRPSKRKKWKEYRGSNQLRKMRQKHVPHRPLGWSRYSSREYENITQRSLRMLERAEKQLFRINPEHESLVNYQPFVHWTLLDPWW